MAGVDGPLNSPTVAVQHGLGSTVRWISQIAALLCIAALPRVCVADQGPATPGWLSAVSYHTLSAGAQIAVVALDDGPIDLAVRSRIEDALMQQGRIGANRPADATLTFLIKVESEPRDEPHVAPDKSWSGSTDLPDLADHHWAHLRGSVDAEARVRVPLYRLPHSAKVSSAAPTYVLSATVDDTKTGQRLWQGEITYRGAIASDDTAAFNSLVPRLAREIGHTVRGDHFRLD